MQVKHQPGPHYWVYVCNSHLFFSDVFLALREEATEEDRQEVEHALPLTEEERKRGGFWWLVPENYYLALRQGA
jgi:hypothetical protein